ncbi:uncharacterized protein LOC111604075 [Drosophila hydei]|uniref:Uncharacterized protein LOC111604075 n=1 Tax=Drosophila hydei TaxID=7224 RepID=A0A6J1M8V3_DROHY|nr:uncharacterized protein LOC111604075 [Drosophila hydei]
MKLFVGLLLYLLQLQVQLSSCWGFYKYTASILQIDVLPHEEELVIDFSDLHIIGRQRALNGTIRILEDMDSKTHQMSVDLLNDPNLNGQWKTMIFAMPLINVCYAMRFFVGSYGKSTMQLGVNTNVPFDGTQCPLPKGTYFTNNLLLNSESWPDVVPYGGLRVNLRFFKHNKPAGGLSLTIDVQKKQ